MGNRQEKSADIIAEMRAYAKRCREENFGVAPECEAHYNEDDVEDLADRLEAAMRRECKNLDALERACEEVLDAETLKKVVVAKRRIQGELEARQ